MTTALFSLCLLLGLILQHSTAQLFDQIESNELRFMALGDFGYINYDGRPHPEQQKVANHVINQANNTDYNFIVAVGDNFYPSGLDSHFDYRADVLLNQTFHINELGLDWYAVLGNHDLKGDMQAALELNERFPLWKQTQPYYSQIMNIGDIEKKAGFVFLHSCDLVCVNTSNKECYRYMRQNVDFDGIQAQIDWLDQTLAGMAADDNIIWKVVVIHNPIFSAGKTHGDNKDLQRVILPMFKKYKVDIVLTGHDHSAQYLRMDMIEQSQETTFLEEQMRTTFEDCILEEFIKYDESSNNIRGSVVLQGEHMHHFVLGNGGVHSSRYCPSRQINSEGKLQYGNAALGIGDVTIGEYSLEVKLTDISNKLLYSLVVIR